MFTLVLTVVLRALVLLLSSLPTTSRMLFNNSTVTIGKAALLKYARTDLQARLDEVALEVALELEVASAVASAHVVVALVVVVASEVDSPAVEASEVAHQDLVDLQVVSTEELMPLLQCLMPLPTMLPQGWTGARPSTFAM